MSKSAPPLTKEAVRVWLQTTGVSQSTLAGWAGLSESALSKWLKPGARGLDPESEAGLRAAMLAHPPEPRRTRSHPSEVPPPPPGAGPSEIAAPYLARAMATLADLMDSSDSDATRKDCALALVAYASGKPGILKPAQKAPPPPIEDHDLLAEVRRLLEARRAKPA